MKEELRAKMYAFNSRVFFSLARSGTDSCDSSNRTDSAHVHSLSEKDEEKDVQR